MHPALDLLGRSRRGVRRRARHAAAACLIALCGTVAAAGEGEIVRGLRQYFSARDAPPEVRAGIAADIQRDPAFQWQSLSRWLHAAAPFEALPAGPANLSATVGSSNTLTIALRIPTGYDPARPWPLIYALHGTGGDGDSIIRYFEQVLGSRVDEFLIAAPTGYAEVVIHDAWPPLGEHAALLRAIRQKVHVDSDRVLISGYSRGGHATWTAAVLYADQFAGALPLAGSFMLPEVDRLWDQFLPNLSHLPVVCCWGGQDRMLDDGHTPSPQGGISGLNGRLRGACADLRLPVQMCEDEAKGHGGIVPPPDALARLLERRRERFPPVVAHRFRHVTQANAYWLEGVSWVGPAWDGGTLKVERKAGEDDRDLATRAIRSRLGELRGEIEGQVVRVHRKAIGELIVWFGDDMIDWTKPVRVELGGKKVWEGELTPDLAVCLQEAARSYDFDRLRRCGIRVKRSGDAQIVRPGDRAVAAGK